MSLELFLALWAFLGAWYGLSGAPGVPLEWLEDTPFRSYRIPSIALGAAVGGSALAAGVATIAEWSPATALAGAAAGAILVAWIVVQVRLIGSVSWLQPVCLVYGLALAALGLAAAAQN